MRYRQPTGSGDQKLTKSAMSYTAPWSIGIIVGAMGKPMMIVASIETTDSRRMARRLHRCASKKLWRLGGPEIRFLVA